MVENLARSRLQRLEPSLSSGAHCGRRASRTSLLAIVGIVFFACVAVCGACTLTEDEFTPRLVAAEQVSSTPASALAPDAGAGRSMVSCASDIDCPDGTCSGGNCSAIACTEEEGLNCKLVLAQAPACSSDADCAGGSCQSGTCRAASCQDGQQNADESAVDCGGHCAPCGPGDGCRSASDCASGVCSQQNRCSLSSCSDGVKNQDETDVDCGGGCSTKCVQGASCQAPADCASGLCASEGCPSGVARCCQSASCSDGVRNGSEPVIDCGNADCGPCPIGHVCTAAAQCQSSLCEGGLCVAPRCSNAVRDGSETDVDCGGTDASCARCALGQACAAGSDCGSGSCLNGRCTACGDGVKDGNETDVDCGGSCGPCIPGRACSVDTDCTSGACQDARCCGGNTVDCTRCARRLAQNAIQCSTAGNPDAAASCDAFLQCLSDHSNVCTARYAPGCSAEPDAVCSVAAFGGESGLGVQQADHILGTLSCSF